jgi:hypothetical protein
MDSTFLGGFISLLLVLFIIGFLVAALPAWAWFAVAIIVIALVFLGDN